VPLTLRRNPRARRLILRVAIDSGRIVVTMPAHASFADALAFARSRGDWILGQLARLPPRLPFTEGAVVPVLGDLYRIRRLPGATGSIRAVHNEIVVGGPVTELAAQVKRWLHQRAREEVGSRVGPWAARIGRPVRRITIRDPRTRWGSCSSRGDLSFSWRLVMAPTTVLDYVVAHEVAHLAEAGHGPRFWQTVGRLTAEIDEPREWLRREGHKLYRYG
jgi:hypothetical protein